MEGQNGQDSGTVPDFLRLGRVPVNYLQSLETDLLDPVVFNEGSGATTDGFCRFTLQNKGFLHSHSKLFISLVPGAGVTRAIFPPNVGVGSVVKRAVLKVGNKVINEISDWDYLHAAKSCGISNENNVERELYTTGRCMNNAFIYGDGEDNNARTYGLEVGRNVSGGTNMKTLEFSVMDVGSVAESPTYAIDLNGFNLNDFDSFSNDLVQKFGLRISQNQEDRQETINENIPEEIHNFDIKNMIGKVVEGKYYSRNRYPLKVRRVEI